MFLPPVIERELRVAVHRPNGTRSRFRVALTGVIFVALFLLISALGGSTGFGGTLHRWFFYWGLYLAIVPPARISIGLFSEERRNQTLELLYLTGMTSGELFVGKLLGGALIASSDLLALAPLLAAPFLMGGISLDLYLATIVCLPAVLLFCTGVGTLASVLFDDEGAALIFMVLLAAGTSLAVPIPYYLGKVLGGTAPFSTSWLCLSPAYAPYLVTTGLGGSSPQTFWLAMLGILGWSGLCLALACFWLSRNWRNTVRGAAPSSWQGMLDRWMRGAPSWRIALRQKLLPAHPYQWLVQQDRQPVLLGFGAIGVVCFIWLLGWCAWPKAWPSAGNFLITALVLVMIVNWLTLFAAARRMGMDRRDGILELLLTTPLAPQDIVAGEVRALEAGFKPMQMTVLSLLLLMMAGGFLMRSWDPIALITYLTLWGALCFWCVTNPKGRILNVMWAALNSGRPIYSVFKWRGSKWNWFWIAYIGPFLAHSSLSGGPGAGFPSGSFFEFITVCFIGIPACADCLLGRTMHGAFQLDTRRRLIQHMRLIATEPLPDPDDPAFKDWDGTHPLQYRGSSAVGAGWPVFADPFKAEAPGMSGEREAHGKVSLATASVPRDALALFELLKERGIDYAMIGGLAMQAYLGDRYFKDADLIMSAEAFSGAPELRVLERTDYFICAQFREIRVVLYLTTNPFFATVRRQFATTLEIAGIEVPSITVEGLIALHLYAVYLISRQREFYRVERHEVSLIALLSREQTVSLEAIWMVIREHFPEQYVKEAEDTLEECGKYAVRMQKRVKRRAALNTLLSVK